MKSLQTSYITLSPLTSSSLIDYKWKLMFCVFEGERYSRKHDCFTIFRWMKGYKERMDKWSCGCNPITRNYLSRTFILLYIQCPDRLGCLFFSFSMSWNEQQDLLPAKESPGKDESVTQTMRQYYLYAYSSCRQWGLRNTISVCL